MKTDFDRETAKIITFVLLFSILIVGIFMSVGMLTSCATKPTCNEECRRTKKIGDEITKVYCDDPSNKKLYRECNQFDGAHP